MNNLIKSALKIINTHLRKQLFKKLKRSNSKKN